MRYKYYFFEIHRPDLVEWLTQNSIKFTLDGGGCVPIYVNFALWSTDTNIKEYLDHLSDMRINKPVVTAEYTATELSKAKLLMISSKRQCIEIVNSVDAYHYSCTWVNPYGIRKIRHTEQKALFVINKEPSVTTKTAFWHEDTGLAEMFTDRRVKSLVLQNDFVGIDFKHVILKGGEISQNIFQITSPNKLMKDQIAFGYGEERLTCPICGKEQYFVGSAYQLHLDFSRIKEQSDLYVTERIFGEGITYPTYVISQRFYQSLKENKLTGNLIISPVIDIASKNTTV